MNTKLPATHCDPFCKPRGLRSGRYSNAAERVRETPGAQWPLCQIKARIPGRSKHVRVLSIVVDLRPAAATPEKSAIPDPSSRELGNSYHFPTALSRCPCLSAFTPPNGKMCFGGADRWSIDVKVIPLSNSLEGPGRRGSTSRGDNDEESPDFTAMLTAKTALVRAGDADQLSNPVRRSHLLEIPHPGTRRAREDRRLERRNPFRPSCPQGLGPAHKNGFGTSLWPMSCSGSTSSRRVPRE